jgi:alpha-beta hydrolase superfamily lysophospholipase
MRFPLLNKKGMSMFRRVIWGIFVLIASGTVSSRAWALDEASLPRLQSQVLSYFDQSRTGTLLTHDLVQLRYHVFPAASPAASKGILVFLPGRTEPARKYAELIYDLRDSGYTIYTYDHRGQGESQRLLDDPFKGHVADFQNYVDDLSQLVTEVIRPGSNEKLYLVANSMGGAVATLYALQNPDKVTAMVESSPMYEPNLGKYSQPVGLAYANALILIGKGSHYAPDTAADDWREVFDGNAHTTSRARFELNQKEMEANPIYAVGGPTVRWVREAIQAGYCLRGHASNLTTPTLIFRAEDERIVMPEAEEKVCAKAKSCRLVLMKGSRHEVFMEQDSIRNLAIQEMLRFFN